MADTTAAPATEAGREFWQALTTDSQPGRVRRRPIAEWITAIEREAAQQAASAPAGEALRAAERHAAESILDRPSADPDDDAAIVARAALRLAAAPPAAPRPDQVPGANQDAGGIPVWPVAADAGHRHDPFMADRCPGCAVLRDSLTAADAGLTAGCDHADGCMCVEDAHDSCCGATRRDFFASAAPAPGLDE